MRWTHFISGLAAFGAGLFLTYMYSPLVVQCIKGAAQPLMLLFGSLALLSVAFNKTRYKKANGLTALVLLSVGAYGVYDEYLATKDFFLGGGPLALLVLGLLAIGYGLKRHEAAQDA